ncbi:MAG: hypothetical protein CBD18_06350 [Opitutales bacterium TMED158]|nr:MAG: hypothetical protein CBD18_06350 [Opitutales bacterium TMED158]
MGTVYLNGENVDFQGPAPATPLEVWSVLENHLSQSGMLIERMEVDGADWVPGSDEPTVSYGTIHIHSVSQSSKATQIVDELRKSRESLEGSWLDAAREVLRSPWDRFQPRALELLDATQPLIQSVSVLVAFGQESESNWGQELQQASHSLNEGVERLIDAFEARDSVSFSDAAGMECLDGVRAVFGALDAAASELRKGAIQ